MEFEKEEYKKEFERLLKEKKPYKFFIKKSPAMFKIKGFIRKCLGSYYLKLFGI